MSLSIRPYHPSDLVLYYRICLQTGDSGKDATAKYKDPDLIGHFYAAPYAVLEPDVCFTLCEDHLPVGYIIGTRDSVEFARRCEQEWFPPLRQRYPLPDPNDQSPDAHIIRLIHNGYRVKEELIDYPAHLHIDILPQGQGKGFGRRLIDTFVRRLRELRVPALHLEVGKRNPGAIKFYQRTGFHVIKEYEWSIAFGMRLDEE